MLKSVSSDANYTQRQSWLYGDPQAWGGVPDEQSRPVHAMLTCGRVSAWKWESTGLSQRLLRLNTYIPQGTGNLVVTLFMYEVNFYAKRFWVSTRQELYTLGLSVVEEQMSSGGSAGISQESCEPQPEHPKVNGRGLLPLQDPVAAHGFTVSDASAVNTPGRTRGSRLPWQTFCSWLSLVSEKILSGDSCPLTSAYWDLVCHRHNVR